MAGREDKYTTRALMGEGKLSMPSFPSFKKVSPAQREMEAQEAQKARDSASEKTLRKYNKDLINEEVMFHSGENGLHRQTPQKRRLGTTNEFENVPTETLTNEEGKKKGGRISAKYMSFSKTGKPARMKPVTKTARGGGIESKGKTKGRFV